VQQPQPPPPVPEVPAATQIEQTIPAIIPKTEDITKAVASVDIGDGEEEDDEIDENDPLWKATLEMANGNREEALRLLEDPDSLMKHPQIIAALALDGPKQEDSWEDLEAEAEQKVEVEVEEEAPSVPVEPDPPTPSPAPFGEAGELEVKEDEMDGEAPPSTAVIEADPREHLNIVFIGHVDAGKSTLSGQILYTTGFVDKRTIEKYEREAKERNRESWFLAFIMDTNEEERQKGKTVEVGRAHFETVNKRYTILDAPGHKSYVPNMIAGAAQADVGILVISARRGEFETGFEKGGQTREHALLAKTLGVVKLIVVINKMDDPTVEWQKERYDECVTKLKPFLRTCGYAVKRDVCFIPISGLQGANIKDEVLSSDCDWWGPLVAAGEHNNHQTTLLGTLDALEISEHRKADAPLVMPVLDRYYERGTVVMGKVEQGTVRGGMDIMIMPTKHRAKVDSVYINDQPVKVAKPGENVKVRVNIGAEELHKGFVLCSAASPCKAATSFVCQIALVETLPERPIYTAGYPCMLHIHTAETECTCVKLISVVDKKTGKKKKQPHAIKGSVLECRLAVSQSICVEAYETTPQLGRFTLRDSGKEQGITIGIGKILKVDEHKKK